MPVRRVHRLCRRGQANGVENFPLYEWTKKTIEDPAKKEKYIKSFTLYVGGEEVYEKDKADALEAELKPLVGGPIVAKMFKYDTDPGDACSRLMRCGVFSDNIALSGAAKRGVP